MNALAITITIVSSALLYEPAQCDVFSRIEAHGENSTALQTIPASPWVSSTSYRGTTDILTSCIFTLLSCVYTAVHLNVPPEGTKGWMAKLQVKLLWVTIALLAPEVVLYMACSQFLEALWLKKQLEGYGARQSHTAETDEEATRNNVGVHSSLPCHDESDCLRHMIYNGAFSSLWAAQRFQSAIYAASALRGTMGFSPGQTYPGKQH